MFLWWSKDWEANSPRKGGEPHGRPPPATPGGSASGRYYSTPTTSSVRRAQIVSKGTSGTGVVFGNDARLRGAGDVAREDAAMSAKGGGTITAATTTPESGARPGSIFGWTPAFFSWLLPGAEAESAAQLEAERRKVAELEAALALARSTQNKPSNVYTGSYSKWQVAEHNRQVGMDGRDELMRNQARRRAFSQRHAESGLEKVREAQSRKGAVAEAIKRTKEERMELGAATQREKREWYERREAQVREYQIGSARVHALREKAGDQQRERMLQSRQDLLQERRNNVLRAKQEAHDRALSDQVQTARQLDTCRQKVDKVREDTAPTVAAASARQFYNARLQTADVVRRSLSGWNSERKERKSAFAERARQGRLEAQRARKGGWEGQLALKGERAAEAKKIRASSQHIEVREKHLKLETEAQKRAAHDVQYATRFVEEDLAEAYEESAYADAVNAHRHEVTTPKKIKARGNWQAYFGGQVGGRIGGSGFFSERIYV